MHQAPPDLETDQSIFHVAIAADRNFSVPAALACESIVQHARCGQLYHIHLLGIDIEEQIITQLTQRCQELHFLFSYHEVANLLEGISQHEHHPPATYARFLLPELLAENVERVLYIDADIMLVRDIEYLFEIELGNHLLAGVEDLAISAYSHFEDHVRTVCESFGLARGEIPVYYNAGQLVMNLKLWREEGLAQRCLSIGKNLPEELIYKDQDIINALCRGRILTLPLRYSVAPHFYPVYEKMIQGDAPWMRTNNYTAEDAQQAMDDPALIHYLTRNKPFVLFPALYCYAPFYRLWRDSMWKHRIPYMPHKFSSLVASGVRKYRWLYRAMRLLCYIPFGYECWWAIARCIPGKVRHFFFIKIDWIEPEALVFHDYEKKS